MLPVSLTLPSVARQHLCWFASAPGHERCRSRVACTSLKDAWPRGLLNFARALALAGVASVVLSSGLHPGCISPTDRLSHREGLPLRCRRVPRSQIQGFEPTTSAWSGTAVTPLARLAPLLGFPLSRASRRPSCTVRPDLRLSVLPRLAPGAGFHRCSLLMLDPFPTVGALARLCGPGLASQGVNQWASWLSALGFCKLRHLQPLPPELSALVQPPVPRWLSSPGICNVAVALAVAVRSALPPRCPLRLPAHDVLAAATLRVRCCSFPSHAVVNVTLRSCQLCAPLAVSA